ncbi:MAG: hypothetical protein QG670_562 [Thermoproteota archaeon]|nr:hypothetical protein [Thermoproteota archaeon]
MIEELREEYRKAEQFLTTLPTTKEEKKIENLEAVNSILTEKVVELFEKTRLVEEKTVEVERLKLQMGDMQEMMDKMQKLLGLVANQKKL